MYALWKLNADPTNYKTKKALIAAKIAGLHVEVVEKQGSPAGRLPILETPRGCIFSSNAITRYIARTNRTVDLCGRTFFQSGLVDSWMEFCTHELEIPLCTWVLPLMGGMDNVPEATAAAKEDVKKALSVLNDHLKANRYLAGEELTLADIAACCALVDAMQLAFDPTFLRPYDNLMRWFNLCLEHPDFKAVLGDVQLCQKAAVAPEAAATAPKASSKAPKAPKAAAVDAAAAEADGTAVVADDGAPVVADDGAGGAAAEKASGKKAKQKAKAKAKSAAPPAGADSAEKKTEDLLKKVIKEGGKRGVEIEGAADMGGLQFFSTAVDAPDGDIELLLESLKAMNEKCDPGESERKGGSGHIGKMIFSAGVQQLAVAAYVPEAKQAEVNCKEWLEAVLKLQNGELLSSSEDISTGRVVADGDKGIFPLKIRESMIIEANNFLRKKGLFPEDDSSDEMIFGDDDFPM